MSAPKHPLRALLEQVEHGTPTVSEMARNTGIGEDLVRAGLAHLLRTGRLQAQELPIGCPPGGCGACVAAESCEAPVESGGRRLVTLSVVRAN
jgi:hypothetical protein